MEGKEEEGKGEVAAAWDGEVVVATACRCTVAGHRYCLGGVLLLLPLATDGERFTRVDAC